MENLESELYFIRSSRTSIPKPRRYTLSLRKITLLIIIQYLLFQKMKNDNTLTYIDYHE